MKVRFILIVSKKSAVGFMVGMSHGLFLSRDAKLIIPWNRLHTDLTQKTAIKPSALVSWMNVVMPAVVSE